MQNNNNSRFDELCNYFLKESMVAGGVASVTSYGGSPADSGATGGSFGNSDSFATGDARNVYGQYDKKRKKRKSKKKKKKSVEEDSTYVHTYNTQPIQKRPKLEM